MKFIKCYVSTVRMEGLTDSVAGVVQPYISAASEITVNNGLLLKNNRIIVPSVLHLDILDKLHSGHQGISKCRERARQAVW